MTGDVGLVTSGGAGAAAGGGAGAVSFCFGTLLNPLPAVGMWKLDFPGCEKAPACAPIPIPINAAPPAARMTFDSLNMI